MRHRALNLKPMLGLVKKSASPNEYLRFGGFLKSITKRVRRAPAFVIDGKKKMIRILDEADLMIAVGAVLAPRIRV